MKKLFSEIPFIQGERLILKPLKTEDAPALKKLIDNERVYRYEPTFLFERQFADAKEVIDRLYTEGFKESIILGIFEGECFCGLAEFYGYRDEIHKISVGYRLREECWGRGIATETLRMMIRYLEQETDIEIVTASTMEANQASANVLRKNGFVLVSHAVMEDWGYKEPIRTDKWIR